ncbi:hypothetical protein HDU98_009751, partial [Podochytrium sp. JEL0797]
ILTSFNSPEGKKLFKLSLAAGTAESFLHLSGNLAHQSEPAFCGLGSLAIVLNALEIDPNRSWKGAWRWYDETLLDCCSPLETIKAKGITFDEFASLAGCNGLQVETKRVGGKEGVSKQEFVADLKRVCGDSEGSRQMVVSFSRKVLHQTGDGHFSPVGCFHEETGMVLVLDVARFKYPSYFVKLDVLYEAMKPVDKVTGKSRGYFVLSKKHRNGDTVEQDIIKRGGNYKSVIESRLKNSSSCAPSGGCAHDDSPVTLTKITPLSLSKSEGVVRALNEELKDVLNRKGETRDSAIRDIVATLLGSTYSATQESKGPGVLAMTFRKPAIDLAMDESVSTEQSKSHAEQIELLVAQIEAMPIYNQVANQCGVSGVLVSGGAPMEQEERYRTALSTLLVVSLPGSIYLALQNPELRNFFMEAKYALSQGPKSRVKSEVERLESQLTNLMNKV